jgi:hypothetical protein
MARKAAEGITCKFLVSRASVLKRFPEIRQWLTTGTLPYATIPKVEKALGLDRTTIMALIRNGYLVARRSGRSRSPHYLVSRESVLKRFPEIEL